MEWHAQRVPTTGRNGGESRNHGKRVNAEDLTGHEVPGTVKPMHWLREKKGKIPEFTFCRTVFLFRQFGRGRLRPVRIPGARHSRPFLF